MYIEHSLNQKKLFLDWKIIFFWFTSAVILSLSYYKEYIDKVVPCPLCEWQRYLYLLIFLISPIGLIRRYNLNINNIFNIIFLISFALSTYHVAIQLGFVEDRCTFTQKIADINDYKAMLEKNHISCATTYWKFFGISASIYNAIFSFFSALLLKCKQFPKFKEKNV